jgi:hypothetical protein
MNRTWIAVTGIGAALLLSAGLGSADQQCIQQAISDYKACKAQCQDDFQSAKFACRGVNPACGLACLAGRQVCFENANNVLQTGQLPGGGTLPDCATGTDGCKAQLQQDKQACGAPCAQGDEVCNTCVDNAQVKAFTCRDRCRERWSADPTVQQMIQSCRDGFKACVRGCPHS